MSEIGFNTIDVHCGTPDGWDDEPRAFATGSWSDAVVVDDLELRRKYDHERAMIRKILGLPFENNTVYSTGSC